MSNLFGAVGSFDTKLSAKLEKKFLKIEALVASSKLIVSFVFRQILVGGAFFDGSPREFLAFSITLWVFLYFPLI